MVVIPFGALSQRPSMKHALGVTPVLSVIWRDNIGGRRVIILAFIIAFISFIGQLSEGLGRGQIKHFTTAT